MTDKLEPGSFLDQARKERERLTKPRFEDFDLPGYTTLKVRYTVPRWSKTKEIIAMAYANEVSDETDLLSAAEQILACCHSFLHQDEKGEWVVWEIDGKPVRYDERLAEALGIELPPHPQPRDVVYAVFGGLPLADRDVVAHAMDISDWIDNGHLAIHESLAGN